MSVCPSVFSFLNICLSLSIIVYRSFLNIFLSFSLSIMFVLCNSDCTSLLVLDIFLYVNFLLEVFLLGHTHDLGKDKSPFFVISIFLETFHLPRFKSPCLRSKLSWPANLENLCSYMRETHIHKWFIYYRITLTGNL